jgi:hypothetical protein
LNTGDFNFEIAVGNFDVGLFLLLGDSQNTPRPHLSGLMLPRVQVLS